MDEAFFSVFLFYTKIAQGIEPRATSLINYEYILTYIRYHYISKINHQLIYHLLNILQYMRHKETYHKLLGFVTAPFLLNKKKNWQRAIFAQRTIFAAMMLNFCVRYGYRCVHHAIITRSSLSSILQDTQNQTVVLSIQARLPFRSSPRPISISPLNMSPCLHS